MNDSTLLRSCTLSSEIAGEGAEEASGCGGESAGEGAEEASGCGRPGEGGEETCQEEAGEMSDGKLSRSCRLSKDQEQFLDPDTPGTLTAPELTIPAFMEGNAVILPAAKLPIPLGARGPVVGTDGEDEWELLATETLVPRWAAECIRDALVWGQCLWEEDSLGDQVSSISNTPGEMDKWKRLVGWGVAIVRELDWETAKKWDGGLLSLLGFESWKDGRYHGNRTRCLMFTRKLSMDIGIFYWDEWTRDSWKVVRDCLHKEACGSVMDDSDRQRIERLLAEGRAYWDPKSPLMPELDPSASLKYWDWRRGGDRTRLLHYLSVLLSPPEKRKLSGIEILTSFAEIWAHIHHHAGRCAENLDRKFTLAMFREEAKAWKADAEAHIAEAKAETHAARQRLAESQSEMEVARNEAEAMKKALELANQKREEAEEGWKKAEEAKLQLEAIAEDRNHVIEMFGEKIEKNTAATEGSVKNTCSLAANLESERDNRFTLAAVMAKKLDGMPKIIQELFRIQNDTPGITMEQAGKKLTPSKSKSWVSKQWKQRFPGIPWAYRSQGQVRYNPDMLGHNPQS